ncbi:MAG: hypothetical protein Q8881_03435, partial [Sweet potato little leaf phytoplasma]|nr:hypothetical protein [Sweet potato little leaf phytoplasma]
MDFSDETAEFPRNFTLGDVSDEMAESIPPNFPLEDVSDETTEFPPNFALRDVSPGTAEFLPNFALRVVSDETAEFLLSQPDSGEVALNIANLLFEKNAVDLVVVDSVAALAPLAELNG